MVDTSRRKGLGRGLAALIDDAAPTPTAGAMRAPVDMLDANPDQPRKTFDEAELAGLAASISANGVIQPLVVRRSPRDPSRWQIVAGERRWRAAQRAGVHDVPIHVREMTDAQVLEVGLVENLQRADLAPLEEAAGYAALIERFGHTQDKVAEITGKSRSHVANMMRLLHAPPAIQDLLRAGALSAGHARAALAAADPVALARAAAAQGLSVRDVERRAKSARVEPVAAQARGGPKDPDTVALEQDLSAAIGMRVVVSDRGGEGVVTITYRSLDQLDGLCRKLAE